MKKKIRKVNKKMNKDKTKIIMLIIIIILVCINVVLSAALILSSTKNKNITNNNICDKETITYNEIKNIIDNKEDIIIYYYNSNSSNKFNIEIKNYLDELKLRYYTYDDANVNKEEYEKILPILGIDSKSFGIPAIIYMRDGKMYGNLINIDSKEVVKNFADNYDLYTIK